MGLHLDNEEVKHNLRNEGVSLNRELGFGLGEVLQCAAVVSVLYWIQRRVHRWAWELVTDPKHAPRRLYGVEIVPPAPRGLGGLSHVRACGVWAAKLAGWLAAAVVVSYLITCMGVYSTNPHVRTAGLPWASHGRGRMGQGGNSSVRGGPATGVQRLRRSGGLCNAHGTTPRRPRCSSTASHQRRQRTTRVSTPSSGTKATTQTRHGLWTPPSPTACMTTSLPGG